MIASNFISIHSSETSPGLSCLIGKLNATATLLNLEFGTSIYHLDSDRNNLSPYQLYYYS